MNFQRWSSIEDLDVPQLRTKFRVIAVKNRLHKISLFKSNKLVLSVYENSLFGSTHTEPTVVVECKLIRHQLIQKHCKLKL